MSDRRFARRWWWFVLSATCGAALTVAGCSAGADEHPFPGEVVHAAAPAERSLDGPAQRRRDPVDDGLEWLVRRQRRDGSWGGPADTGIALLTFLAYGDTHSSGQYRDVVKSALKRLVDDQQDSGLLAIDAPAPSLRSDPLGVSLRDHAVAACALTEAFGMTGSNLFREPAQRAVQYCVDTARADGGWSRRVGGEALDLETTTWMVFAVRGGEMAELVVPPDVLQRAAAEVDEWCVESAGFDVSIADRPPTQPRPLAVRSDAAMTMLVVMLARPMSRRQLRADQTYRSWATVVESALPAASDATVAEHRHRYFATLAMQPMPNERWEPWRDAVRAAGVDSQVLGQRDPDVGSWTPTDAPDSPRARLWATAFNILTAARHQYADYRYVVEPR